MAQQKLAGKVYLLSLAEYIDGTSETFITFGCSTQNDFQRTMETSQGRCKEDGGFADPVPTVASGALTQDGLYTVDDTDQSRITDQLDTWLKDGTTLLFRYGQQGVGEKQDQGKCILTSLAGPTAGIDDTATYSLELQTKGEWTAHTNA